MTRLKQWMLAAWIERTNMREEGQGLAEYGLILALIAVVAIAALTALGNGIVAKLNQVTAAL